jgi:hypothetical protein
MPDQIQKISANHQKILKLPREQLECVFGSDKHMFKINPPATLNQIIEHELKYRFNFPAGYRRFILEVGDGGAGPFFGIKQQFTAPGGTLRHEEAKHFHRESIYQIPCPEDEEWQNILLGPDYRQIEENDDTIYSQGNMVIFEVGLGIEGVLVLNGPMAGAVCITDHGVTPYSFWRPPQFLDFYEAWQEAVLCGRHKHNFSLSITI